MRSVVAIEKAREILYDVWAAESRRALAPNEAAWLTEQCPKAPTMIDAALAIVGIDFNWRSVDGFDARAAELRKLIGGAL